MTKGPGMAEICDKLEDSGFRLSEAHAVEIFARQGDWHTLDYYHRISSLEAWEIDAFHLPDLRRNLSSAVVRNVNSIEFIKFPENRNSADLLVIDNPQSTFGENNEYCEHFDVLDYAVMMLRPGGALIFNVNIEPFDYDKHPGWRRRREDFYGSVGTAKMSIKDLADFYQRRLELSGRSVTNRFHVSRTDYLYYFVYVLS